MNGEEDEDSSENDNELIEYNEQEEAALEAEMKALERVALK
jgi:hypothetical protein